MKLNRICICLLVFAAVSTSALAAGNSSARMLPGFAAGGMTVQGDEAADYKAWYDANDAKDFAKAYDLAKAFVAKYTSGTSSDYLKKWIPAKRTELFNTALNAKDVAKMLQYGNEALAEDPNNVDYLYYLATYIFAYETPNFAHATENMDYIQRLMKQVEGGKVPFAIKDNFNKDKYSATLYAYIAGIDASKGDLDKVLDDYKKASALDPKNPAYYFSAGLAVYDKRFKPARTKYEAIPEADRNAAAADMKPDVKAAQADFEKQMDAVIEIWAHYLAVVGNSDDKNRDQIMGVVGPLYKYRHPDMADGLQKMIDQYKSGPVNPMP